MSFRPTPPPRAHALDALVLDLETTVVKWLQHLLDKREDEMSDEAGSGGWILSDLARLSQAAPVATHRPAIDQRTTQQKTATRRKGNR